MCHANGRLRNTVPRLQWHSGQGKDAERFALQMTAHVASGGSCLTLRLRWEGAQILEWGPAGPQARLAPLPCWILHNSSFPGLLLTPQERCTREELNNFTSSWKRFGHRKNRVRECWSNGKRPIRGGRGVEPAPTSGTFTSGVRSQWSAPRLKRRAWWAVIETSLTKSSPKVAEGGAQLATAMAKPPTRGPATEQRLEVQRLVLLRLHAVV